MAQVDERAHAHDDGPLDRFVFGREQTCFGCGPFNDRGMQLRFEKDGDVVRTRTTPTKGWDGPPGVLHGGLQATLIDEVAGWTLVGFLGRIGLTTSMNVRYMRPVRLGEELVAEGTIASREGEIVTVKAKVLQGGRACALGRVSYALVDGHRAEQNMGQRLPPGWGALFGVPEFDRPIYHICKRSEWEAEGPYRGSSQDQADGFIHLSSGAQVRRSAAKHRAGQTGLLLLRVDPHRLGQTLKWEPSRSGKLFPHIYGELPRDAVTGTWDLPLGADGAHDFPDLDDLD